MLYLFHTLGTTDITKDNAELHVEKPKQNEPYIEVNTEMDQGLNG